MNDIEGLPALRANKDLWYKIHVLLHDLENISTDPTAESHSLATTGEPHISSPYFTSAEAFLIKSTQIPPPTLHEIPEFGALEYEGIETLEEPLASSQLTTIEEAIKRYLGNFFEKRRASGDARPCGRHDMGPVYRAVFGIAKEEFKDERF